MPFDYLATFPIPAHILPPRLRGLLEPVGLSPDQVVEVASMYESDPHGEQAEHLHLLMAVVPGPEEGPIEVLFEAGNGVVEYSVPVGDKRGVVSNSVCEALMNLSTAAFVACDERPTRWASRCCILTQRLS